MERHKYTRASPPSRLSLFLASLYRVTTKLFYGPTKFWPIQLAVELDDHNRDAGMTGDEKDPVVPREDYVAPCFRSGPAKPQVWTENGADAKVRVCVCMCMCMCV